MINEKPSKAGQGRQTKAKEGVRPRPASEEERQVGGCPRPASEEERQVGGRPRPASEEERQVGGCPRPASEEERQVGGRPRPAVNKTRSCQRLDEFFFFFKVRGSRHHVNSGPSLPKARHKPERRGGGKTGMIDVNGKNNKVEQKNNKKIKTMGDVTLKGYDMTNTVTKGTGVRVHKQ